MNTVFTAALFMIAKKRIYSKWPSSDELINKMCYIHTMERYSALKRNTGYTMDERENMLQ